MNQGRTFNKLDLHPKRQGNYQSKPVLQALAAFIRSTANKGLWSAKQVKNFAEAVDEKIKALAPESSTPEVKTKKDNKPTVGRVVPMKKFKKGKYKK